MKYDDEPYFDSGDECEHSAPTCQACQDEDAKAKAAEFPVEHPKLRSLFEARLERSIEIARARKAR